MQATVYDYSAFLSSRTIDVCQNGSTDRICWRNVDNAEPCLRI